MSEVAPTTEVVTMGSVRPDDKKRGVPLDRATFRVHANVLARQGARMLHGLPLESDPSQLMRRVHLIGDATLLAVQVAQEHESDFGAAVDHLRKIFVNGEHHDYENTLDPFTREKLRVEEGITRVLGQSEIEIHSSIQYLRDHRRFAELTMDILGALFSNITHSGSGAVISRAIDLSRLTSLEQGKDKPRVPLDENLITWKTLAKRTLPTRLRKNESSAGELSQMHQTFYGALEGAMAASVINDNGFYLSYRGSEKGGERPITENMRTLIRALLLYTLSRGELEKRVGHQFIVDPLLDGIGFLEDGQKVVPKTCDPHTLDSNDNGSEDASAVASQSPRKLPLLYFEHGVLRPVRPEELRDLIVNDSGGVAPSKAGIVVHNVAPLGQFLKKCDSIIPNITQGRTISTGVLVDWREQILKRLERLEMGRSSKNISPLIPGRNVDVWGSIVAAMGKEILVRGNL